MIIDTLIHPSWVIPVEPEARFFERHSLAIDGGRILDILPAETARMYRGNVDGRVVAL